MSQFSTDLRGDALVASRLMSLAGYELHINSDPSISPSLLKVSTVGNATRVSGVDISFDDAIDLQRSGLLVEDRKFGCDDKIAGVEIRYHENDGDIAYWCQPVGESKATYSDGETRLWQERDGPVTYTARKDILSR